MAVGFLTMNVKMKKQVAAFDKTPVDISKVNNGTYEGNSNTDLVKVEVKVTVHEGTLEKVELVKHECGLGSKANVLADNMVAQNTVEVDAVSGATMSSEVIKDAVRNALRSNKNTGQ